LIEKLLVYGNPRKFLTADWRKGQGQMTRHPQRHSPNLDSENMAVIRCVTSAAVVAVDNPTGLTALG
jgi:hypothetical protein